MGRQISKINIWKKGLFLQDRLRPGRMLLVDLHEKCIVEDEQLKMQIAHSRNHKKLTINRIYLDQIRKDDVVSVFLYSISFYVGALSENVLIRL